ncbi:MAG TPA: hypothetical protein DER40_18065 [Geobacter sp.]|nr:hypothetical protein [Geobacter sp.]
MLSTVTSKGQITIPKDIRTLLNIMGVLEGRSYLFFYWEA